MVSILQVVRGPPLPPSWLTAALHHSLILQHPQSLDVKTERRGRIRFIEHKSLVFTQLAVINDQHLYHFDIVALRNGSCIHKCWLVECMASIWGAKNICFMGNPGIRGVFSMQNTVFITWLNILMLIDIHTPLIIPNRVPIDACLHYHVLK